LCDSSIFSVFMSNGTSTYTTRQIKETNTCKKGTCTRKKRTIRVKRDSFDGIFKKGPSEKTLSMDYLCCMYYMCDMDYVCHSKRDPHKSLHPWIICVMCMICVLWIMYVMQKGTLRKDSIYG